MLFLVLPLLSAASTSNHEAGLRRGAPSNAAGINGEQCHIFAGATIGQKQMQTLNASTPGACCDKCTATAGCAAWTYHRSTHGCFLKDNAKPLVPPRHVDPHNGTMSGLPAGQSNNKL